jgi:hypothetical protein
MESRASVPPSERRVRSRLAQLAGQGNVLRGSLTLMRHACGKRGCRCARGEKHESWYLGYSAEGKKRMVSIPRERVDQAREGVARYQEAKACLEVLSQATLGRLRERKKAAR